MALRARKVFGASEKRALGPVHVLVAAKSLSSKNKSSRNNDA